MNQHWLPFDSLNPKGGVTARGGGCRGLNDKRGGRNKVEGGGTKSA